MPDQWNKESLLQLGRSFMQTRILLSAAELNLFSKLTEQPRTVDDLCSEENWSSRALTILLDALAAMELVNKSSAGEYSLEAATAQFLSKNGEQSILPMLLHNCSMWRTWSNLTEIVRTGAKPSDLGIKVRSQEDTEAFIGAMHVVGSVAADRIAKGIDLSKSKKLLDIGGGSGVYTMAFLRKAPHMEATIYDLPRVCGIARRFLAENGFADKVRLIEGDFTTDNLPKGFDLVLLSAIIHMLSRSGNRDLYRKAYESLDPGGRIIIRDHIMDESRTLPPAGSIFAVNMLVATEGGGTYTFAEVKEDLQSAGFKDIELIQDGMNMDQLVSAVK